MTDPIKCAVCDLVESDNITLLPMPKHSKRVAVLANAKHDAVVCVPCWLTELMLMHERGEIDDLADEAIAILRRWIATGKRVEVAQEQLEKLKTENAQYSMEFESYKREIAALQQEIAALKQENAPWPRRDLDKSQEWIEGPHVI